MNVGATDNNAAQVALNAAISNSQDAKSAQNAQKAGAEAILNGDGVTVTTASPTAAEVATARAGADESAAILQETVNASFAMAEEVDALATELQAAAVASGETATTVSAQPASTESVISACEDISSGNTEAAEETVSTWVSDGESVDDNFSIYQLANLLQEVGQEQRNAARELRDCELNTEIASIDSQATKQRRAATLSCMVSICTAVVQAGLTIGGAVGGGGGGGDSDDSNLGVSQDTKQAETSASTIEAATTSPEAAASNVKSIESQTTAANKTAVEGRMSECNAAKATYEKTSGDIKGKISDLESFKSQEQAKLDELNQMPGDDVIMDADGHPTTRDGEIAQCNKNIAAADETIGNLKSDLKGAQDEYVKSLDSAVSKVNNDYNAASEETKIADNKYATERNSAGIRGNSKNYNDAKAKQGAQHDLGQQKSLVEAQVASEKANMGITPSNEDLAAADANVAKCQGAQQRSPAYKMEMKSKRAGGGGGGAGAAMQGMAQVVGTLGNSLAQMVSTCGNSAATEEQANQKTAEAYRDETNDLFKQAQSLIDNSRQLLQAVIQSESQSIEKIISA